ncbi:hypothetical protein A33Q_1740 [Indibacter alkaliphilus LW1]|uniref:Uncharacterized protein n=1 Tax=Indibacter alkaliphilus (strain CCUG 57479 / KCTC 22604 / LW1) TaxID=1189612 RepID=S2DYJ4_INDAL|nr:hypothetical protein A33Q_1740 [Indibacter alkaliphilus LW1]
MWIDKKSWSLSIKEPAPFTTEKLVLHNSNYNLNKSHQNYPQKILVHGL